MNRYECDRMLVAVLELGSFAAAARRMGVSAATASKMIARLETELGVQLIKRTTRALSVTEAGQTYFEGVRRLLESLDELDAAVTAGTVEPTGRLRISVPHTFGVRWVVPSLNAFAAHYERISLDVTFSDEAVNLVQEGYDAAVRIGRLADSTLIARRLTSSRDWLVAAPAYLQARGTPQTPADLAAHDCIIDANFRDPCIWGFEAGEHTPATRVAVESRLSFSNAEAVLDAACAELGIARIPSFVAAASVASGDLVRLLPEWTSPGTGVYVLHPAGQRPPRKVRLLIDWLVDHFDDPPSWETGHAGP
ncbi:LysR family transcriptional regulator [Salinisphaera shabanensis]|nr:LysR family transcriptional regulator [Salinisphaera shabanensis]